MRLTLYHNPRCSKSREALRLLQERETELAIVEYLKTPPDAATLRTLLAALDCRPAQLIRTGESLYRDLALADADDTALIDAMVEHPILIERPIAWCVQRKRAVIGRPPENVLALL